MAMQDRKLKLPKERVMNSLLFRSTLDLYHQTLRSDESCKIQTGFSVSEFEYLATQFRKHPVGQEWMQFLAPKCATTHGYPGTDVQTVVHALYMTSIMKLRTNFPYDVLMNQMALPLMISSGGESSYFLDEMMMRMVQVLPGRAQYFTRAQMVEWEAQAYRQHKIQGAILNLYVWDLRVRKGFPVEGLIELDDGTCQLKVMGLTTVNREIVHYEFFAGPADDKECWLESSIYKNQFQEGSPHHAEIPVFRCRNTGCNNVFKAVIVTNSGAFHGCDGPFWNCGDEGEVMDERFEIVDAENNAAAAKLHHMWTSVDGIFQYGLQAGFKILEDPDFPDYQTLCTYFSLAVSLYNVVQTHQTVELCPSVRSKGLCNVCLPEDVECVTAEDIDDGRLVHMIKCYPCVKDIRPGNFRQPPAAAHDGNEQKTKEIRRLLRVMENPDGTSSFPPTYYFNMTGLREKLQGRAYTSEEEFMQDMARAMKGVEVKVPTLDFKIPLPPRAPEAFPFVPNRTVKVKPQLLAAGRTVVPDEAEAYNDSDDDWELECSDAENENLPNVETLKDLEKYMEPWK